MSPACWPPVGFARQIEFHPALRKKATNGPERSGIRAGFRRPFPCWHRLVFPRRTGDQCHGKLCGATPQTAPQVVWQSCSHVPSTNIGWKTSGLSAYRPPYYTHRLETGTKGFHTILKIAFWLKPFLPFAAHWATSLLPKSIRTEMPLQTKPLPVHRRQAIENNRNRSARN